MANSVTYAQADIEEAVSDRTLFGFWVYLMTDLMMFAVLFAVYVVLRNNTNGGPSAYDLFSLPLALSETIILLTSSLTSGLSLLTARRNNKPLTLSLLMLTFLLGLTFYGLEMVEFSELYIEGHTMQSSAFLSAFFALLGTHGIHILFGLLWLLLIMAFVWHRGLNEHIIRKINLLSIYWHFLDIVWIFIFSIVYLMAFV